MEDKSKKVNDRKGTYETHQYSSKGKEHHDTIIWNSDSPEEKQRKLRAHND